jgi:ElaB/YqjD/DUF883 family membrane-anchored ribosome-binding protein
MEASQREGQEGQVQEAADQAREKVGEAADQAKQTAQNVASQAQDRVREQVDQRSTEAGERVGGTAEDIRSVGQELRKQGKEGPAKLAEQAAERIDRAGSYLRESDADRILNDAEDFGRRQPWAVLAGAVVVGFAAARFLKASSRDRYSSRQSGSSAGSNWTRRELSPSTTPGTQSAPADDVSRQTATPAGVR